MNSAGAIAALQRSRLAAFTTSEAAALWGSSRAAAAEMLRRLATAGIVRRVRRGLWVIGEADPLALADRIAEPDAAYISGLTALRLHGMIEQIPTDIHVATTGRARKLSTPFGRYAFRHLQGALFGGYDRSAGRAIATSEKALFDILYWSATRGGSLRALPEITFPKGFDRRKIDAWIFRIPSVRHRVAVKQRVKRVL